jgi:hypothetical protein
MTVRVGSGYDLGVPALRSRARRWIVAGALLCCAATLRPVAARAATASFEVRDQAVVQVVGRVAAITIHTWNRNIVQVDWPDGEAFEPSRTTQLTRPSLLIPTVTVDEFETPGGPIRATLLPEDFPISNLVPGEHDLVRVRENPPTDPTKAVAPTTLTVTIPMSTGLVSVRTGRGSIALSDYHGTTIALIGRGQIVLRNVSGDAFVQPLGGRFYALDSNFDRLRIRSNRADEIFDGCRVTQIEATTLTGNIVFDNGVFNPGLARFGSDRGAIALGVSGGAQFGAYTQDGRVLSMLPPSTSPEPPFGAATGPDNVQLLGSGGPLVNAASVHGNIFLYAGSLADRSPDEFGGPWRTIDELFERSREALRPAGHPRRRSASK